MLKDLKCMLGLEAEDDKALDAKLEWILASVHARLKLLLGGAQPPEEMNHIITEVSIIRFNRVGSEGLSAHSVEGESLSFNDSDFTGFSEEIQAFLGTKQDTRRGRVMFR